MATLVDSGGGGAFAGHSRLQTRIALLTILLGIYLLLMASYYLESYWNDAFMHPLKYLSAGTAFATQGAHVAIIYGLFVRRFLGSRDELVYGLCASLACGLVFTPLSCFTLFAALLSKRQEAVGLWEMPRIGLTLFHMYLIRRLLKELRASDTLPPPPSRSTSSAPSPSSTPPLHTSDPRPLLPPPRPPQPPPAIPPPPPPPATPPPPTPPTTSPPHSPPPSPPPSPPTRSSSTATLTPPPPSPPSPPTPPPTPHLAAKTQQAAPDDT